MKALNLIALSLFATTAFISLGQSNWNISENGFLLSTYPNSFAQQSDGDIFALSTEYHDFYMEQETFISKSTDGGLNWSTTLIFVAGINSGYGTSIFSKNDTLYFISLGEANGSPIYRSTDDGVTWTHTMDQYPNFYPYGMTFDGNETIYTVTLTNPLNTVNIIRSSNYGSSWTVLSTTGISDISTIHSIKAIGSVLLLSGKRETNNSGVIYKSTDGGSTWAESTLGFNVYDQPKAFTSSGTGLIYLVAKEYPTGVPKIYRSWDEGNSWLYQPSYGFNFTDPKAIQKIESGYLVGGIADLLFGEGVIYKSEPNVGMDEVQVSNTSVSPNPTVNSFNILSDESIESTSITDYKGSIISNYTIDGNKIDVAEISSGIYFLSIIKSSGIETIRFVKE